MKVAFIVAYFGKLPDTFNLWLRSCSYNQNYDFYVVTDDTTEYILPSNVFMVHEDLKKFRYRVNKYLGFDFDFTGRPYKTCDYRPLFGKLFPDILNKYDYFGQCELDMLFGKLDHFLDWKIISNYEKAFDYGHLTIYKNDSFVYDNLDVKFGNNRTFRELLMKPELCNCDEQFHEYSINTLFDTLEEPIYEDKNENIADIAQEYFQFRLVNHYKRKIIKDKKIHQVFSWKNGVLMNNVVSGNDIIHKEYIYIHLQKRKLNIKISNIDKINAFIIVPNAIIPYQEITKDYIIKNSKNKIFYKQFFITHMNGLKLRLYRLISGDKITWEVGNYKKKN